MKKKEAEFTRKFLKWARSRLLTSCAIEVKHTRGGNSFRMSEWREHQRDALAAASSPAGLVYKIPDDGRAHKPFDAFMLVLADSWVVIAYPKCFVGIAASRLARWDKPSLPLEDAVKMASFTVLSRDL